MKDQLEPSKCPPDTDVKKDLEEDDPIMSSLQIRMGLGINEVEKASQDAILDI
jgi:hypothetical protein